jgi:general stress protein CsbA
MKSPFWPLAFGVIATLSYLYHPQFELMVAQVVVGMALTVLIIWSSAKVLSEKWWVGRLAMLSVVAGLMNATALNVFYSLLAAPAGGRFSLGLESVMGGLVLTALGYLWFVLRPKEEIDAGSNKSKR